MSKSRQSRISAQEKFAKTAPRKHNGRPRGPVPLRRMPGRWEIAWFATWLRWKPDASTEEAADIGVAFAGKSEFASVEQLIADERYVGIKSTYKGGRGQLVSTVIAKGREKRTYDPKRNKKARESRRNKLSDEAPAIIEQARGHDQMWLEVSVTQLMALLDDVIVGDRDKIAYTLQILAAVDKNWPTQLARLARLADSSEVVAEPPG